MTPLFVVTAGVRACSQSPGHHGGKLPSPKTSCTCVSAGSFSVIAEQITAAELVPRRQGGSECGHCCAAWHLLHLGWLDLLMAALLPPTSLQKLAGQVRSPTFGLVPGCACPSGHCFNRSWGRLCTSALETNTLVVFGSEVPCWDAVLS